MRGQSTPLRAMRNMRTTRMPRGWRKVLSFHLRLVEMVMLKTRMPLAIKKKRCMIKMKATSKVEQSTSELSCHFAFHLQK